MDLSDIKLSVQSTDETSTDEHQYHVQRHQHHGGHGHYHHHHHHHHHHHNYHHQHNLGYDLIDPGYLRDEGDHQRQKGRRPSKSKRRKGLKRHAAQTHLAPLGSHLTLGVPSENPVRRSIVSDHAIRTNEFIVHYDRKLHSHLVIDSRHEEFYKKNGFPKKPAYNPVGRRFSDSSETDPDYNREEFKTLAETLNAKLESSSDDEDNFITNEEESSQPGHHQCPHHHHNQHGKGVCKGHATNKQYLSPDNQGCFRQAVIVCLQIFCCCCVKKQKAQVKPLISIQYSPSNTIVDEITTSATISTTTAPTPTMQNSSSEV